MLPPVARASVQFNQPDGIFHFKLQAFDTPDDPYLPDSILWRQKEQFSDGVGYVVDEITIS